MKDKFGILFIVLLFAAPIEMLSQNRWERPAGEYFTKDSLTRGRYTLIFVNKDSLFSKEMMSKLDETFFTVYPAMAKRFNKKTSMKVLFVIDPAYKGVAATSADRVVFNPLWFRDHPGDIDVVTHEVMHIVQAYGNTPGPGWLTEGIADYVRYRYGVDNAGANWLLPEVNPEQSYTNAYRVTARFLVWTEQRKNKKIVDKLDRVMRDHTYQDNLWEKLTGQALDDLWHEYLADPKIKTI